MTDDAPQSSQTPAGKGSVADYPRPGLRLAAAQNHEFRLAESRESVRESLAKSTLMIFGGICGAILLLFLGFLLVIAFSTFSAEKAAAMEKILSLLLSSLLPAIVGVFGSIIGYYFGSQERNRS